MHNTLESSRLFPYVAWTVVIGFALFTYGLTKNLHAEISAMEAETVALEVMAR